MTSGGRLAQRVALVTGGGGEIGGAICRRFAAEGAEVAIADLDPAKSEAVARAIAGGGRALALEVDVADEASAKDVVERTVARFGRLTTLVNVAATVTPDGTVETLSLEDWNKAIAVNLAVYLPGDMGDLRAHPAGGAAPMASSLNFRPGIVRSNSTIIPLGAGGQVAIQCDMPSGSTNAFIDVFGYFQ